MEDRSTQVLAVGLSFLILTWLSVGLRVYVRVVIQHTFASDDYLIVLTLMTFSAYIICQIGGVAYGTGKHMADLQPEAAETALHFWWYCELFYILASGLLKISVGVFLLRVVQRTNKMHIWIIRVMLLGTTVFSAVFFLAAIFQCRPVSAWWRKPLDPGFGFCLGPNFVLGAAYTASVINSFADFTFAILPYFIVRNIDIPRKQKMLVAGILAFAGLGCIATLVRLPYIMNFAHLDDFLWTSVDIAIWSTIEPGIGISAACVVSYRPLLQAVMKRPGWWTRSSSRGPHSKGRSKKSLTRSYGPSESGPSLRPDYVGNFTEITSAGRTLVSSQDPKEFYSPIDMMSGPYSGPGINKKVEVTFTETDTELKEVMNERWIELKSPSKRTSHY